MTAKIKLNAASGGGSFSLQAPSSSANNRVFTLPDIADATMATVNGITQSDEWRITTAFNATSGFITSNWERNDTEFSLIGSGMTESSGVFTFPETGIYRIVFYIVAYASNKQVRYVGGDIFHTTDNSNYNKRSNGYASISNDANVYCSTSMTHIFDVTNTSTHKVKFNVDAESEMSWDGSSTQNRTYATFTRLGDT